MAAMDSAPLVLIVSCLFLQIAGGKDFYWQPNSNWGNPSNWAFGQVPGCGDRASLASVPPNSVVYLDVDTTVQSISLAANGQLVLAPSVTIQLAPDSNCIVPGDTQPMAAAVKNEFIGAATNYWECATNWLTEEDVPAEHPPCGTDRAVFQQGAFSHVNTNASIAVRSLSVRGTAIQSKTELSSAEFNLEIEINSACGENPSLCPCPGKGMCPKPTKGTEIVVAEPAKSSNLGGVIGGVVFGFLVILAVVTVVIVFTVILYLRKKTSVGYVKDELLEDGTKQTTSAPENLYDNPLFNEEQMKVDLSSSLGKVDLGDTPEAPGLTTYEANPPLYAELGGPEDDEKNVPKLNKYERF